MTKIKVDLIGLALMVVVALIGHAIGVPPFVGILLVAGAVGWLGWDLWQDKQSEAAAGTGNSIDSE